MSSGPQDGLTLILYLENSQMDDDPMDYDTFSALGMYFLCILNVFYV